MKGTGVRGVWSIIVLNSLLLLCPIVGAQQPLLGRSDDLSTPAVRGQHMGIAGGVAGQFSILHATNASNALEVFTMGTGRAGFFRVANPFSSAAALWGEAPTLALFGKATASNGFTYGGRFESASASGRGILGWATATTGQTIGVYGRSESNQGIGVYGLDTATAGITYGIYGESRSPQGIGVFGAAVSTTGTTYGVRGKVNSPNGFAGYFEGRGYFANNLGIGTNNPAAKLHVVGNTLITGSMNLGNSLRVTGTTTLENTLNVAGAATFGNTLSVSGDASVGGTLSVTGQSTLTGKVGIGGAPGSETLRVTGTTAITSHATIGGALTVDGNTRLGDAGTDTLTVNASSTFNNIVTLTNGGLTLSNTAGDTNNLTVGDNASIGGTLTVSGPTAASFFSAADGTATSAAFRFQNDAGLGMFRPADDTLAFSTAATERMRLTSDGRVGIGTTTPSQRLHVAGNTRIDGDTQIGQTLSVTGATSLGSTLSVIGNATLNNTLNVSGATTLNNTLNVSGAATLGNTLTVSGATALNNTLDVSGATTLNNTLNVAGATTLREVLVQPNNDVASLLVRQTVFSTPTADIFAVQSADGSTSFLRIDKDGNVHLPGNLNVGGSLNGAAGGDLSGTYPNPTVVRIQGRPVSATAPSSGQVLKWDGSQWTPGTDNDTTYSAGAGLQLAGTTFSVATGGIVTAMLADGAVTTAKIADDSVTSSKLSFPIQRTQADANPLLDLTNTGAGAAVRLAASGTALEIAQGALKVTGAGIGTSTPVFIHQETAGGTNATTIDHPLTNGDPNAILIVTYNATASGTEIPLPVGGYGVRYNTTTSRWEIYLLDSTQTIPAGATFNVMVVKP